jgi:hypothetical protein
MISGMNGIIFAYGILTAAAICLFLFTQTPAGKHWLKKL